MGVCTDACGAHEECDVTSRPPQCVCVAGYTGNPCTWGGAPLDPDFESGEPWTKTNGATVLPFEGIAFFEPNAACNAGQVSQTFEMPRYADAEPLVAEVSYRANQTRGAEIGFGTAFSTLRPTGEESVTARVCLGEAAYGGPIALRLSASERDEDCLVDPLATIEFDRLWISPAESGECPAPGEVLNGSAEPDLGGWLFEVDDPSTNTTPTLPFQEGLGREGSSGARLYRAEGDYTYPAMVTQMSVPMPASVPGPALEFWWTGTEGGRARIEMGTYLGPRNIGRQVGRLFPDGEERTNRYCLPPWTHGSVVSLIFVLELVDATVESELVVDDVRIVSDPRCGNSPSILDPGFDSAPNLWPGVREGGAVMRPDAIRVLDDPTSANTGRGVLEMRYTSLAQRLRFTTWVLVPPSEGDQKPQLVFYSKVPQDAPIVINWFLGSDGVQSSELLPLGIWDRTEVCLPEEWAGRWFRFQVRSDQVEPPIELDPPMRVLLDDFSIGTSAACDGKP